MSEYFEFEFSNRYRNTQIPFFDKLSEYNRKGEVDKKKSLILLKEQIGASIDLALKDKSCCNDNEFLMRFLYARKFRSDEAFNLLIKYHLYKQKNYILLQGLSVLNEKLQNALRDGFPTILTERDRRGRKAVVFFASNWDPCLYTLEIVYKAFLLSLDKLLDDEQNQSQGFIIIVDWTNFTLRQTSYLHPKTLKLMIEGLQDCFPAQFKAIHFIGQPWYVEAALAVIKPFFKEKIRYRIKLHGGNLSTLHEFIPKDILPPELGGEALCPNPLDWYHTLLESSQVIESPKTYRITQTMMYSKTPDGFQNITRTTT